MACMSKGACSLDPETLQNAKNLKVYISLYFVLCLYWTLWITRYRNVSKLELQAPLVKPL